MSNDTKVIVKDADRTTLDGRPVDFLGTEEVHGSQLISVAQASDVGEAVKIAIEQAKQRAYSFPFALLEIERPSSRMRDPKDHYIHVMSPDNRFYLFAASFFKDGVVDNL